MARVGRLAGALLAETGSQYFLVGDLKMPCDFAREGFESPGEVDAKARPWIRLSPTRTIELSRPCLVLDVEGESLTRLLAERFLIERNASVSDRLWNLVTNAQPEQKGAAEIPARWLGDIPNAVWRMVRDTVLKCS